MTLAAMDINLCRKSDLPLKRSCFRVSDKGRAFYLANFKADVANFAILAGSHT